MPSLWENLKSGNSINDMNITNYDLFMIILFIILLIWSIFYLIKKGDLTTWVKFVIVYMAVIIILYCISDSRVYTNSFKNQIRNNKTIEQRNKENGTYKQFHM